MIGNIIMIHGMWSTGWYWDQYKAFFEAKGWHCHTPTLRHHDISPGDPPPSGLGTTSLQDYADDLEKLIQKLDEKPILMGHSMGGLLAQILAARDLARAAVLITPASPAGVFGLKWSAVKTFKEALFRMNFWKKPHTLSYEAAVYGMMHKLPEPERRKIYSKCVWESGFAATEIGFWLKGAKVNAKKLTCPLLVVAGSDDRITPSDVVKKTALKYKQSSHMEFEGHAHWILREPGWGKPAGKIHSWLKENV